MRSLLSRLSLNCDKKILYIAFGGSLYWASSILLLTSWKSPFLVPDAFPFETGFTHIALGLVLCLFFACSRVFFKKRYQVALALAGVVSVVVILCLDLLSMAPTTIETGIVGVIARAFYHACFVLFWGLNFALLNKAGAERTVFLTMLLTFIIYVSCCWIPVGDHGFLVSGIMKVVSLAPFLMGKYELTVVERDVLPGQLSLLIPFFTSRVFFGFALGILFYASGGTNATVEFSPLFLVAIGVLLVFLMKTIRTSNLMSSLLRVTPLIILGVVCFPFLGNGNDFDYIAPVSVAVVWFSWITLSSVQASDLKERVGIDEVRLSFSEKAVVMVALAIGYMAATFILDLFGAETSGAFQTFTPFVLVYLSVVVASFIFSNLIDTKERQRLVDKAITLTERQMEQIYDDVARAHGLTGREREVLALMAQGHSRRYICDALCISEGTVRSHANHIYQKMGIHSRDELFRLIGEKRKSFSRDTPLI